MVNQCCEKQFYFGFTYLMLGNTKFDVVSLLVGHVNSMLSENVINIASTWNAKFYSKKPLLHKMAKIKLGSHY